MILIEKIKINIPEVSQEFELGDLTIFIGRSNCGKTRILNYIDEKTKNLNKILNHHNNHPRINISRKIENEGVELTNPFPERILSNLTISPRNNVSNIEGYTKSFTTIEKSVKIIDSSIQEFGTNGVKQNNEHKSLNLQGTGVQNIMQIFSNTHKTSNLIIIDEPESSQFPSGKVEILKQLLTHLKEKQVIFATHDPTFINQYLIKKILNNTDYKIVIYSFCEKGFEKINFQNNTDPDVNCNYLNQTISGKPIHLFLEGETEFYLFPALINKYCLKESISSFPKAINKINIGFLGGQNWETGIFHLPPPEFYEILVVLDNEHLEKINKISHPNFKIISSLNEYESSKVNILCLDSKGIEKAFEGIFENPESISKPSNLSWNVWNCEDIIEKLEKTSEKSKQIHEIVEFIVKKAN